MYFQKRVLTSVYVTELGNYVTRLENSSKYVRFEEEKNWNMLFV